MWIILTSHIHRKQFALDSSTIESVCPSDDGECSIVFIKNNPDINYPVIETIKEVVSILNESTIKWTGISIDDFYKFPVTIN